MENIIDRVSFKTGNVLGTIRIKGRSRIGIVAKNKSVYGVLDGYKLLESGNSASFMAESVPILAKVAVKLCKDEGEKSLGISKRDKEPKYKDLIEEFTSQVSKDPEDIEIQLLETQPDEVTENSGKPDISAAKVAESLNGYNLLLAGCWETSEKVQSLAMAMLRTRLAKNMWGGKDIQKILDSTRHKIEAMSEEMENFESAVETTDRNINSMMHLLRQGVINPAQKAMFSETARNFFAVKKPIIDLAKGIFSLYTIDPVFRKHTGFPTTWFFNSSLFYDFLYHFESLIEHMIDLTKAEAKTVEPLLLMGQ
jgi:hypothetical protein